MESIESKEILQQPNFVEIYNDKLKNISPLSGGESFWDAEELKDSGLRDVVKKAPCLILYERKAISKGYNIWLEDLKHVSHRYPHDDVSDRLKEFLKFNNFEDIYGHLSGYAIQDSEGKTYLLFERNTTGHYAVGHEEYKDGMERWENLMKKYGLEKILGNFTEEVKTIEEKEEGFSLSLSWRSSFVNLVDDTTVGRLRENSYLYDFAEKYSMTNNQFMRFRLRATAGRQAALKDKEAAGGGVSYLIDLDDLAKEVINQDKEEGHL